MRSKSLMPEKTQIKQSFVAAEEFIHLSLKLEDDTDEDNFAQFDHLDEH